VLTNLQAWVTGSVEYPVCNLFCRIASHVGHHLLRRMSEDLHYRT
jgi:hypothetical protein